MLSDLDVLVEEYGGAVDVGPMPVVEADPLQMRQLFQNLIGNALKFSRPGAPPAIRVEATTFGDASAPEGRPLCRIAVRDNGIGFEEKYLDRIFMPFQRLHTVDQYDGTGIGLAICRRIAERHGGSITAQSTPGEGSVFVVNLPVEQNQDVATPV